MAGGGISRLSEGGGGRCLLLLVLHLCGLSGIPGDFGAHPLVDCWPNPWRLELGEKVWVGLLPPFNMGPSLFPQGRQGWCRWTACASAFWGGFGLCLLSFPASGPEGNPHSADFPAAFLLRAQLQTGTSWTDT